MIRKSVLPALILYIYLFGTLLFFGCAKGPEPMVEIQVFAMDTYLRLVAPSLQDTQIKRIKEEVARLDRLFNRFSPGSDISRVNEAAGQWMPVDRDTVTLLERAKDLAVQTQGCYDPTIGPLVELWQIAPVENNQEKNWEPPTAEALDATLPLIDYEALAIDPEGGQVRLAKPGMKLDVGGIAKGYAVDRLAELLQNWGIAGSLIDFGGDYYALGSHPEGRPWKLGIRHPRNPEQIIAYLSVENQAVTTSGDYQRYRIYQGRRFSHLLNPKTGYPGEELTSVTVVAPKGITADALSTAVFVMGKERGLELVESWPGVETVIIDRDMKLWISSGLKENVTFPVEN
ncbi:MAG: FAD:protein FMN transferase [Clostridia bacterium]|jgi:thiamine biosynthesis lipoprotein|nr:FAD:protein FMN transferase [Clostridia bacterium]